MSFRQEKPHTANMRCDRIAMRYAFSYNVKHEFGGGGEWEVVRLRDERNEANKIFSFITLRRCRWSVSRDMLQSFLRSDSLGVNAGITVHNFTCRPVAVKSNRKMLGPQAISACRRPVLATRSKWEFSGESSMAHSNAIRIHAPYSERLDWIRHALS